MNIAHAFSIKWNPEPRREEMLVLINASLNYADPLDRVSALSEILDPALSPLVDLPRLRKLCARGKRI